MIFDLWDTLVDWPLDESQEVQRRAAQRLGLAETRFVELWQETYHLRQTGPIRDVLRALGADEAAVDELLELREAFMRDVLVPRPGAVETLRELRQRGYRLGLLSVCSEEVPALWEETAFAGLFDATVFSCSVGLAKPDPRIYRLTAKQLGVEPEACLFVGDGANNELAGAARVGMASVLVLRPGQAEPYWDEAKSFAGPRITSLPEVLDLV